MSEVVCPNCGHRNEADANFCSSCGTALRSRDEQVTTAIEIPDDLADDRSPGNGADSDEPAATTADRPDLPEVPDGCAYLLVRRGPKSGSRYALDRPIVRAGRHPESDIFLDDVTVSRRHAELEDKGDHFVVRDVGSLNGTYVNRQLVDEVVLQDGDELQVGKFKLVFVDAR